MKSKTLMDWERYAAIICEKDPYNHLRSIHNGTHMYDFNKPWITHCSIQRQGRLGTAEHVNEWRNQFNKPIVLDEITYEGNIEHGWGNISGQEMVRRFWEGTIRGGYAGHGETYMSDDGLLWWSHGGVLKGESGPRIKFMRSIIEDIPGHGLNPISAGWDDVAASSDSQFGPKVYRIYYYGTARPSFREFHLDDESDYEIRIIDTWEMTNTLYGIYRGKVKVDLPGKEYMAVTFKKVQLAEKQR